MDANAYLLEMTGDVLSAMDLIVSHLRRLLIELKVSVVFVFHVMYLLA